MLASASPMDVQTLRDRTQARYPEFLDTLEAMVNVDCGSYSPEGVNRIADMCERRFEEHGWEVERRPHDGDPRLGDLLTAASMGPGDPTSCWSGTWTRCSTTARSRSGRSVWTATSLEDPAYRT